MQLGKKEGGKKATTAEERSGRWKEGSGRAALLLSSRLLPPGPAVRNAALISAPLGPSSSQPLGECGCDLGTCQRGVGGASLMQSRAAVKNVNARIEREEKDRDKGFFL